jgi:hypothetical protein
MYAKNCCEMRPTNINLLNLVLKQLLHFLIPDNRISMLSDVLGEYRLVNQLFFYSVNILLMNFLLPLFFLALAFFFSEFGCLFFS